MTWQGGIGGRWTAGNGIFEDSSGILEWYGSCCLTPRSWISVFPVKLPSTSWTRQKTDRKLMIFPRKSLLWHRNWGWKVNVFTQLWAFLRESSRFYMPRKGCFLCVLRRKLGVFDGGIRRESSTGKKKRRDIWEENDGFVLKTRYFAQIFYFSAAKTTKARLVRAGCYPASLKNSSRKLDLLQFSVCHYRR